MGSPVSEEGISVLKDFDCIEVTNEYATRGKKDKRLVRFKYIPDTIIYDNKTDMCSWRRLCMAIIKNDITCQSLSFSMTKTQKEKRTKIKERYEQSSI